MRGHLRRCWIFTFRTPEHRARPLLPAPLELLTHAGFAFWNVVVCEVHALRPAPLPSVIGMGYWHVAYRLHARVTLRSGEVIEGLYFARSDCDRSLIRHTGNLLTPFRFHPARIHVQTGDRGAEGHVYARGADAHFRLQDTAPAALSPGSPFSSIAEAAKFLTYKPCAISPVSSGVEIIRIRRREADWKSRVVTAEASEWSFLSGHEAAPEICYAIDPIDYEWARPEFHSPVP